MGAGAEHSHRAVRTAGANPARVLNVCAAGKSESAITSSIYIYPVGPLPRSPRLPTAVGFWEAYDVMSAKERFLVIEDDADGEFLIERALLRRFQQASVEIFRDSDEAVGAAKTGDWTGFVVHRALDANGIDMVRRLRAANSRVPIVMVSGRDQSVAATAAGASHFVPYREWQQIANVFESTAT